MRISKEKLYGLARLLEIKAGKSLRIVSDVRGNQLFLAEAKSPFRIIHALSPVLSNGQLYAWIGAALTGIQLFKDA